METTAFIFARGGSKGLPGKNIKLLQGVPLIGWSIIKAKDCKKIDRVIVSTDDREVASIAKEYGADVPFMRPAELAKDDTPEWMAWRHALDYLDRVEDYRPDIMVSLPATSPLRSVKDINDCLDLYLAEPIDGVITVNDSARNPYFNMIQEDNNGYAKIICKSVSGIFRRQDAPVVYDMNTVCFVVDPAYVMKEMSLMNGRVKYVVIPKERAVDIDDLFDFRMAELLISKQ